jgi:hypothetical protein
VLVAFHRTGEQRRLPAPAEHVVGLLRSWGPGPDHLTGLALTGITVPSRLGPRFVDALVFTRSGVVVIAAHAPGAGVSPGPGERAGAGVAAARGALAAHDGGRYVTGLVAIVPPAEEPGMRDVVAERVDRLAEPAGHEPVAGGPEPEAITVPEPRQPVAESRLAEGTAEFDRSEPDASGLESERARREADPCELDVGQAWHEPIPVQSAPLRPEADSFPGVAVVLADPRGLRRIIGQHNRWRTVWSADDVLDACYALSLAHLAPPRAALLADGFPARLPTLGPLPVLPAVVPLPADPPAPVADDEPGPWIPAPRGNAVFPRQRPIRQVPWGLVFVLTLLVTVGVIAAVFVAQVFHGS